MHWDDSLPHMPYPKLATLELLSPGQATSRHSRTHTFPSFPPRQRWIWIRAVQKKHPKTLN